MGDKQTCDDNLLNIIVIYGTMVEYYRTKLYIIFLFLLRYVESKYENAEQLYSSSKEKFQK